MSALTGLTVVDLSSGLASALATMFLADNGARVIRVALRDADVVREPDIFAVYDRGKEVVRLNADGDLSTVRKMCAVADVVVDDFSPGSPLRDQLQVDEFTAANQRLVHCSITAHGTYGPLKDEPADHDLVAAWTGILGSQPSYRDGPVFVVHPVAYVGAGLLAAMGIAAALYRREQTGRGGLVETSLMAGALMYTPKVKGDAVPIRRLNLSPQGGGPFYSVFECADGRWLQIGCVHSGFVDLAAAVIGVADVIASDPAFGDGRMPSTEDARKRLFDTVADRIRMRPSEDWIKELRAADVPCDISQSSQDAMSDPQIIHSGLVLELNDPAFGPTRMAGLPIRFSKTPGLVRGPRSGAAVEPHTAPSVESPAAGRQASVSGRAEDPPLAGVRIMEMTNVIAGPFAGRLLADLGADMIKFESLYGDISRPAGGAGFIALNAGKRSVSANTRTREGKDVARRLAAVCDVILANMRPGATDRMGLDHDTLIELNPDLIESHVTAYGWDGPYAGRPGVDPIAQAITGLQHAQGGYDCPPVYLAMLAPCDYTGGALGALGTVLALLARKRFGVAQRVDTNLLAAGMVVGVDGFMRYEGKMPRPLPGREQLGVGPLRRLYRTSDGWIVVAADAPHDKSQVIKGAAWLATEATAERVFATMTLSEAVATLRSRQIPCAPIIDDYASGFFDDRQVEANRMSVELQHPTLDILKLSGNLISFGSLTTLPWRPTPLLGQHTNEVLLAIGYTPDQIRGLHEHGVVKTEAAE